MKKTTKILALVMAAVLLVGASVMGTLAYLTSTDDVTNTFTVGQVKITLDEKNVDHDLDADGKEPVRDKTNDYKLIPGSSYEKDPTVTVLKGSEESYVRAFVTVTKSSALDKIFADHAKDFALKDVVTGISADWNVAGNVEDATKDTRTYELRYKSTVKAVDADVKLAAIFQGISVPGVLTDKEIATIGDMQISVIAQAIQAEGFADANAAWTAFAN